MPNSWGNLLLKANAIFLAVASTGGMISDLRGAFGGSGPIGRVIGNMPEVAIGFVEAHGLAFIIGILLWRAPSVISWHLTAAAVHALLGSSNIVFWSMFVAADMLEVGCVTTAAHALFFGLHIAAIMQKNSGAPSVAGTT
jgi:hypothetical protein